MTMRFESTAKLVRRFVWLQRSIMVTAILALILTTWAIYQERWLIGSVDFLVAVVMLWCVAVYRRIAREIDRRVH